MRRGLLALALIYALALGACGGDTDDEQQTSAGAQVADVCSNEDGALAGSSFVFVESPRSGERVSAGFTVTGCSNTFEATVAWHLLAQDGSELASGFTQGGTLDQPGSFAFTVEYPPLDARQIGNLEVFMPPVTEEGFPPPTDVVPLVLQP